MSPLKLPFQPSFPQLLRRRFPFRRIYTLSSTLYGALLLLLFLAPAPAARAIELRVSRDSIERTLRHQIFSAPDGRVYLKGDATWACGAVYVEDPRLGANAGRVVVTIKTHAQLGKIIMGRCVGLTLSPTISVSAAPVAMGEIVGYDDVRLERASDQPELNFILKPFLNRQLPKGMQVNAADLLRKALADSTAKSGYKVSLDRLVIRSVQIQNDDVVVDIDGAISVR